VAISRGCAGVRDGLADDEEEDEEDEDDDDEEDEDDEDDGGFCAHHAGCANVMSTATANPRRIASLLRSL